MKFILVGNKSDIVTRSNNKVTKEQIIKFSKEIDALHVITSAKENNNLNLLFKSIYTHAIREFDKLPYTKKINCTQFNNIKVRTGQGSYIYNRDTEVETCWCGFCKIC